MLRPKIAYRPSISLGTFAGIREVGHAVTEKRVDIKQACLRTKAGRHPIGSPHSINGQQVAVHRRLLFRVRDGLPFCINSLRPIQRNKRLGDDVGPVGAIENEKIAVARGLRQQLARLAVDSASKRTGVSVLSQSWVSWGDPWKYQTSLPVSALSATIEQVHRSAPFLPCPAITGFALPVPQYSRFSSGS